MANKTVEQYRQDFQKVFQDLNKQPSGKGWSEVLKKYMIDYARDIAVNAGFAQIVEQEPANGHPIGGWKPSTEELSPDEAKVSWGVEAVMIQALNDLGSYDLPDPGGRALDNPGPTCLSVVVSKDHGIADFYEKDGGIFYKNAVAERDIVAAAPTARADTNSYIHISRFVWLRRSTLWTSMIGEGLADGRATLPAGLATGWWKDFQGARAKQDQDQALKDAGLDPADEVEGAEGDETITDADEQRAERKFQEQCFLIDYYEQICSHNACNPYGKYFRCVGPGGTVSPSSVISRIVAPDRMGALMTAPQEAFVRLQPRIRLFKRYRVKQKPVLQKGEAPTSSEDREHTTFEPYSYTYQPKDKIVEKEILFSTNDTKNSIEKAFAPRPKGYTDGVALRRFEWTYYGSNPFEADRSIMCKMILFFRNIEDLNASDGTHGGRTSTFLDLILFGPEKKAAPNPSPFGVRFNNWNPDYYEVKASIGYQDPPNDELMERGGAALKNLLKTSTTTLGLVLTGHTFNFNEDGSGTLEIEFQGIVESHLSSTRADLFYTSKRLATEVSKIDEMIQWIDSRLASKKEGEEVSESEVEHTEGAPPTDWSHPGVVEQLARAFQGVEDFFTGEGPEHDIRMVFITGDQGKLTDYKQKLVEKRERFIRNSKLDRYSALVDRMIDQGNMNYIDLDESMMGILSNERGQLSRRTSSMAWTGPQRQARNNAAIRIEKAGKSAMRRQHKEFLDHAGGAVKSAQDGETKKSEEQLKKAQQSMEPDPAATTASELIRIFTGQKPQNLYRVNYFYLGDLLEAAFYMANHDPNIQKKSDKDGNQQQEDFTFSDIRFLLGTLTFVDPMTHAPWQVNLADLPISLNLFMSWYLEKVVAPQIDTYYIRNFLRDVVTDLILEVLSPQCFYKYPVRPRFNITSFSGPGTISEKVDRVGVKVSPKAGGKLVPTGETEGGRIENLNSIAPYPNLLINMAKSPRQFFYDYIYCHDGLPWNLNGNRDEDAKNGILHFQVGSDTGILKKVTFDRTDQPYVREARTMFDGSDPIAAQLRLQYNVTLRCFGTTMFKPGMRVHVLPRIAGNLEHSLTYKLGLGGYVFLTKVENIIEPGKFETILYGINDGMVKRIKKSKGDTNRKPSTILCNPSTIEENPPEMSGAPEPTSSVEIPPD